MSDEFSRKRSETLVQLYTQFRRQLDATPTGGRWMRYGWWTLPDPLGAIWMAYSQMLGEYAAELANIINDLTHHVHRLRAWSGVIATLSDNEKLEATHEFIDMLGTVALGLPYTIKSRFAFAAAHLCHQANMAKDLKGWKDEFPDKRALYLNDIEPFCRGWKAYRSFKLKVEPIAGKAFNEESDDFRNAYNHRFSSRFVLGMTNLVERKVRTAGAVQYEFGGNAALDLAEIADLLEKERDQCYLAFEEFQKLIAEQIAAIADFEAPREGS